MILWALFWRFLQIGALTFGGGYASLPLIESLILQQEGWLSRSEYADLLTLSQMTPGPIAINAASFTGMKIAGPMGSLVATVGFCIPPFAVVLLLAMLYYKYRGLGWLQSVLQALRPVVVALIATAAIGLLANAVLADSTWSWEAISWAQVGLVGMALWAHKKKQLSPVAVLLVTGVIGLLLYR